MILLRGKVSWALSEGPGRAIKRNGLAASQTQRFARFPSVLHAASSQCARVSLKNGPLVRAQLVLRISRSVYASLLAAWTISSWLAARGDSVPT